MLEVWVQHSVGETFTANTDTLQHTITSKLVHDQVSIDHSSSFVLIRDNASNEVRFGAVQSFNQIVKLLLVTAGYSRERCTLTSFTLATTSGGLSTGLSRMISEAKMDDSVATLLELIDDSVVKRILVLL
jgi:hypothetical protein